MKPAPVYWHGGVCGLNPGDLIRPGHTRDDRHPGCPICDARKTGNALIDRPSERGDRVYFSTHRLYAKFHASMYGSGDLYRVEPIGAVERSAEDLFPSFVAPAARVVIVFARGVTLTPKERTALYLQWAKLDGTPKRQALAELAGLVTR